MLEALYAFMATRLQTVWPRQSNQLGALCVYVYQQIYITSVDVTMYLGEYSIYMI